MPQDAGATAAANALVRGHMHIVSRIVRGTSLVVPNSAAFQGLQTRGEVVGWLTRTVLGYAIPPLHHCLEPQAAAPTLTHNTALQRRGHGNTAANTGWCCRRLPGDCSGWRGCDTPREAVAGAKGSTPKVPHSHYALLYTIVQ